jgi:predicted MFS family arabinose efflux permease
VARKHAPVGRDARLILVAQGLRAFGYGFGSIFLGVSLEARGWSAYRVGALLAAVVAGTALMSVLVGAFGDRIGRRRSYALLYLGLAATGVAFGTSSRFWVLFLVALSGTLSSQVIESGPFTSLEQAMLPEGLNARARNHIFGTYNAVATLAGSVGALAAGGPELLRRAGLPVPSDQRFFLILVPIALAGAALAMSLSPGMEPAGAASTRAPLRRSRRTVWRLSALFSADSFAGGLVVDTFVAFWFKARFGLSTELLGAVFFGVGMLHTASFLAASRLADRIGLLRTMVFTHLPSDVLLMAIPFCPNVGGAIALLLGRSMLSEMDVPTRQAYVMALVDPDERTAAAAFTNSARYMARPMAPPLAGVVSHLAQGLPFVLAGGIKAAYDLTLWSWFRRVPMPSDEGRAADIQDDAG